MDLGKWIPKRRGNLYYSRIKKKVRVRGKTRKTYDAQENWQNSKDERHHVPLRQIEEGIELAKG